MKQPFLPLHMIEAIEAEVSLNGLAVALRLTSSTGDIDVMLTREAAEALMDALSEVIPDLGEDGRH